MKNCIHCKKAKDLCLFGKEKRNKDGHASFCLQCRSERRDKEKDKLYNYKYKLENKEKNSKLRRKNYLQNKQQELTYAKNYRENNKNKRAYWQNKRKLKIKRASIGSFNKELESIYLNRPEGHHVDHIVPLQGKNISGLHVPWNLQYLPEKENLRKSNKYGL